MVCVYTWRREVFAKSTIWKSLIRNWKKRLPAKDRCFLNCFISCTRPRCFILERLYWYLKRDSRAHAHSLESFSCGTPLGQSRTHLKQTHTHVYMYAHGTFTHIHTRYTHTHRHKKTIYYMNKRRKISKLCNPSIKDEVRAKKTRVLMLTSKHVWLRYNNSSNMK